MQQQQLQHWGLNLDLLLLLLLGMHVLFGEDCWWWWLWWCDCDPDPTDDSVMTVSLSWGCVETLSSRNFSCMFGDNMKHKSLHLSERPKLNVGLLSISLLLRIGLADWIHPTPIYWLELKHPCGNQNSRNELNIKHQRRSSAIYQENYFQIFKICV